MFAVESDEHNAAIVIFFEDCDFFGVVDNFLNIFGSRRGNHIHDSGGKTRRGKFLPFLFALEINRHVLTDLLHVKGDSLFSGGAVFIFNPKREIAGRFENVVLGGAQKIQFSLHEW